MKLLFQARFSSRVKKSDIFLTFVFQNYRFSKIFSILLLKTASITAKLLNTTKCENFLCRTYEILFQNMT